MTTTTVSPTASPTASQTDNPVHANDPVHHVPLPTGDGVVQHRVPPTTGHGRQTPPMYLQSEQQTPATRRTP